MNHDSSLGRAVERACREWEARKRATRQERPETVVRHFCVSLAREAGTGGTAVAQEVGRRLGWPVYGRELVERIAHELGLRANLLDSVDERHTSWLREALEDFMAVPQVSESAFVRHLIETVLALGALGDCVFVGRGVVHVLPLETTLRVRLVAPLKDRITFVARKRNVSRDEAAREIGTRDRERDRFIQDHFLKDPTDPHNYDLVLNAARFSTVECADLIIDALHRLQAGAASPLGEGKEPAGSQAGP
jgi:cytidylate kinase